MIWAGLYIEFLITTMESFALGTAPLVAGWVEGWMLCLQQKGTFGGKNLRAV